MALVGALVQSQHVACSVLHMIVFIFFPLFSCKFGKWNLLFLPSNSFLVDFFGIENRTGADNFCHKHLNDILAGHMNGNAARFLGALLLLNAFWGPICELDVSVCSRITTSPINYLGFDLKNNVA